MGANGTDLAKCLAGYITALKGSGIKVDIDPDEVAQQIEETTKSDETDKPEEPDTTKPSDVNPDAPGIIVGKVEDIRTAVKGGESYYYIRLEGSEAYYSISASDDENVVILNKGDTVTINFSGNGAILKADSLKIN
ncbi:MAG: hypothetical protein IKR90_05530 [Clostridia bacterium]|nr:hypothetical protein [Clostridia bacterium]